MKPTATRIVAAFATLGAALGMAACAGGATSSSEAATVRLRTPAVPEGQARSDAFSVTARTPGGSWRSVGVYATQVDYDDPAIVSTALLETDGPVEVAVTRLAGPMRSVRVRPSAAGVHPKLTDGGRTATFTLPGPRNVSIEPNGDDHANLQLFANRIDRGARAGAGRRVMRYRAGVHEIPGRHVVRVPSRTTVQIDAGAVVHGSFSIRDATDVVVRGGGVIDPSPYFDSEGDSAGVTIERSSHVGVAGVTILRGQNGAITTVDASDVVVSEVKEVNADRYSDGIDVISSDGVLVDRSFFRTSDDSVAIWATSPWVGSGSTRDVTVRDTVLWPDLAHAVLIGPFGEPGARETIRGIDFQNVDVLEQAEGNPQYQGALAVNAADDLTIRDVRFQSVRIDRVTDGQAVNVQVFSNPDYQTTPGRAVRNVLFRDLTVPASGDAPSQISGYADGQTVANVLFENLRRGGAVARDAGGANVALGAHADDVAFEPRQPLAVWNDDRRGLLWSSGWRRVRSTSARGNDVHRSDRAGATLTVRFTGREARVLGPTNPRGGRVAVYVDGARVRTVDTYSSRPSARRILFDTGLLSAGAHTLVLRVLGAGNVLSSGDRVTVDSIEVVG